MESQMTGNIPLENSVDDGEGFAILNDDGDDRHWRMWWRGWLLGKLIVHVIVLLYDVILIPDHDQ